MYDFHHKQNSKKPGSVHATYLITGVKRGVETNGVHHDDDGEDTVIQSSPPLPSSSIPRPDNDSLVPTPVRTIMLVKEEHLIQAKALFATPARRGGRELFKEAASTADETANPTAPPPQRRKLRLEATTARCALGQ